MGRETPVLSHHREQPISQEEQARALNNEQRLQVRAFDRAKVDSKLLHAFRKLQRLKAFKQDAEPCRIANGLYIGSMGAAQNLESLKAAGITHILNASPLVPCFFRGKFTYMVLDVYDDPTEDVSQHFQHTNSFIQEGVRKGGVLVHCFAGVSRSAAFSLAYMIANMQLELAKAFKLLRHARPKAQPNSGFITQLESFSQRYQELPQPS